MAQSSHLDQAKKMIQSIKGQRLSIEQRCLKAIELAGLMLNESQAQETRKEKYHKAELGRMMSDPVGKVFTMSLTDQCFRSKNVRRIADQIQFLIERLGIPQYLSFFKRSQLWIFKHFGKLFAPFLVPLFRLVVHKECSRFILPGEEESLTKAISRLQQRSLRINLNHLGEAILGEKEAERRLQIYLEDLSKPEIEYISVKVSTICSQLNLIAWDETLSLLTQRLEKLLKAAYENRFVRADGTSVPKFVNLDMEEYRDLELTVELFKRTLSQPEYLKHCAGIVLQSYLPEAYKVQQELTEWALKRISAGGAPIKIRLVKGANLAMEKVEASLHGWPQAPYPDKIHVDANFKRMLHYGCQKKHAEAAHIGIGSHNLFDIAYGLLLRSENEVEKEVSFEMLEGMADAQRKIVQMVAGGMVLYCPAATKKEFQNAVAYLIRRLDENTSQDNFLRQAFNLSTGTDIWEKQAELFTESCMLASHELSSSSRRTQNRFVAKRHALCCQFENEQDTDWALSQNREWAKQILTKWSLKEKEIIPLVIGGKTYPAAEGLEVRQGFNPSNPEKSLYSYAKAGKSEIEQALITATEAQKKWGDTTPRERAEILIEVAKQLRYGRADLIGAMAADTGKVIAEADVEISEAIDFVEYYLRNVEEVSQFQDISWTPKGPTLVAPPWNFPCSIPVGGISAALAAGNCVIFKPAPEAVWVGWVLVQMFWKAGVSKEVLQFLNCEDEPDGSTLVQDPRLAALILTGATSTAKHLLQMRPDLDLIAETGGKNAIIVSNLADRDLAVKDIIQSAFGHAGQKCSACSLVICHAEVYNDLHFLKQLKDAASSLVVGIPWDPRVRLNPLIRPPGEDLKRGLTRLEEGEEWLLEPQQDPNNPCMWTPGIKLGVKPNSFTQQTELFGPLLGIMKANSFEHAIQLANQTNYGLTAGLHSLDVREQFIWSNRIEAGNCYINRGITGAIVQRQPFGGWKESCYSPGAKAGGPNYVMQLMHAKQIRLPQEREPLSPNVEFLKPLIKDLTHEDQMLWQASAESYEFYWKHYFSLQHDPSQVLGEDNFLRYLPRRNVNLRLNNEDKLIDVLRVLAAIYTCGCDLTISSSKSLPFKLPHLAIESEDRFLLRLKAQSARRVRFFSKPKSEMLKSLTSMGCYIKVAPILANGRIELLNYLREQSLTIAYHRYGNLGDRELTDHYKAP